MITTCCTALRRNALCVLTLAITMLPLARSAEAQGRWHLDIQAGAFSPITDVEFRQFGTDVEIDLDTGGAFAVSGGYALDRWVDFNARLQTATHFDLYDHSVNVYSFTAGGRFFPLPMSSIVRPWIGTEIGWYHVEARTDDFPIFGNNGDDDFDADDDSFGLNAGAGVDFRINHRVSLGVDVRYQNAFDAFKGFEFVTTMFNVSIWFGDESAESRVYDSDTPPVPRGY